MNKRKPEKVSKEDNALDIAVGSQEGSRPEKENSFDRHVRHVAYELHVMNNVLAEKRVKLKRQDVLYDAKLTAIVPQTTTLVPNSA